MDKQSLIYEYTKELIRHNGLILDQSNKTNIRFSCDKLDSIVGYVGDGWTQSKRMLLFEIENRSNRYVLKLLIGPGDWKIRQKLYHVANNNIQIYNKGNVKLKDNWTTIYSQKFLNEEELTRLSIDEIQIIIQREFNNFIKQDLNILCDGFNDSIFLNEESSVTEWIIICSNKAYDIRGAFKEFKRIQWKQSINVKIGDIIYVYLTAPEKQIKYQCIVTHVNLPQNTINDSAYTLDSTVYANYGRYMEIELIEEYEDEMFPLEILKENGLKSVQGPSRVNNQLSTYIRGIIQIRNQISSISSDTFLVDRLEETEKMTIIKTRIGHSELKQRLVRKECCCKICGLSDERFLIASHIKPWSQSNNAERLDLDNVLLLCPHHDAVFDKGYISFNENGIILISHELSLETKLLLNLFEEKQIELTKNQKKYMDYHRENIFKP